MTLPHLVTSLELSKRLKELNVSQASYFHWDEFDYKVEKNKRLQGTQLVSGESYVWTKGQEGHIFISAFTAGELGEMLPRTLVHENIIFSLSCGRKLDETWVVSYETISDSWRSVFANQENPNEANCRALMLIYLIEYGLINVTK